MKKLNLSTAWENHTEGPETLKPSWSTLKVCRMATRKLQYGIWEIFRINSTKYLCLQWSKELFSTPSENRWIEELHASEIVIYNHPYNYVSVQEMDPAVGQSSLKNAGKSNKLQLLIYDFFWRRRNSSHLLYFDSHISK